MTDRLQSALLGRWVPSPKGSHISARGEYVFSVWHRSWGEAPEPEGLTDLSPGRSLAQPRVIVACTIQAL